MSTRITHGAAQVIGGRSHQCDATATFTHEGRRAYALLDGIGSTQEIQAWTRSAARRLARAAARTGALKGLRLIHAGRAAELTEYGWRAEYLPKAVAVVAVTEPGKPLEVAWCGDARAYLVPAPGAQPERLTTDHNMRQVLLDLDQVPGPYARNRVTSYLGDTSPEPPLGSARTRGTGRLVLASDGAYEPLEDAEVPMGDYLAGSPHQAARALVKAAIAHADDRADNATVLIADLAAAPDLACPECGGRVVLQSRGWATCATPECTWGDMAAVLAGAVGSGWDLTARTASVPRA
ncbi:hypothetical protein SAVIM338S_00003 [Streptomyces avidinii]